MRAPCRSLTRCVTVGSPPALASAESNDAAATVKTSEMLSGTPSVGVVVVRIASGWPLQKSDADCISAKPLANHIWPMLETGVGL